MNRFLEESLIFSFSVRLTYPHGKSDQRTIEWGKMEGFDFL